MSFWKIIKVLNYKQLTSLVGLFFRHPLFMIGTLQATLLTFRISQKEFPNIHGKLNKANAFRHALWNLLIAKKCAQFSNNQETILNWTKKITDWHEEFAPNEDLARAMDYHNNQFGRYFYRNNINLSLNKIQLALLKELDNAVIVKDVKEINSQTKMVYIEP